jgi:hypothetical protein
MFYRISGGTANDRRQTTMPPLPKGKEGIAFSNYAGGYVRRA